MENSYPAGPASLPDEFAKPSKAYRNKAWFAVAGLLLFIALYFFLAGWFAHVAFQLLSYVGRGGSFFPFLGALCAGFIAIFMLKALFIGKQIFNIDDREVTPEQQPRLFAFLYRLADEAGAPRPHRVFLSPRVNASVFYHLSLLNLIFPSKKNLEIGLGLVNVLSLSEFKAVCAHEFGHFAQRSMAVGRWVYSTQQIVAKIVSKRDALDRFLDGLSRIDIRIAWLGWILKIIVWSIRSLIDLAFRGVVLAQRALSREMEMQADLVAVSLAGSDTLIHALHRLSVADDAWDRATKFVWSEASNKRVVSDVYAMQSRIIEHLSIIMDDPFYGKHPPLPSDNPEAHRLFKADFALPPTMWATHPLNFEREENAKRRYIPAAADERSAWTLFEGAQELRAHASARLTGKTDEVPVPVETSLSRLDEQYASEYFNRAYRGAYIGRSVTLQSLMHEALFDAERSANIADLNLLYPESLVQNLTHWRNMEKEVALLESLRNKRFVPADGVMRYRGEPIRRSALPQILAAAVRERNNAREKIWEHDYLCRSVSMALARELGYGWADYLCGLISLLHYADHHLAFLCEAHTVLRQTLAAETSSGLVKTSKDGVNRVINAAQEMYDVMDGIYGDAALVIFDASFIAGFGAASLQERLGALGIRPPARANINDWLKLIDNWFAHTQNILQSLASCTLNRLLLSEVSVANWARAGAIPDEAPARVQLPQSRAGFPLDSDRASKVSTSAWQRFQSAQGWGYGVARLIVASTIIGGVLAIGVSLSSVDVAVYNGLGHAVKVDIDGRFERIAPYSYKSINLSDADSYHVETRDEYGHLIESFEGDASKGKRGLFYNVASASPLVLWTATYGQVQAKPQQNIGVTRWGNANADVLFSNPPSSIKSNTGGLRTVLSAVGGGDPTEALALVPGAAVSGVIETHVLWDDSTDRNVISWLNLAMKLPNGSNILQERVARHPQDLLSLRFLQDSLTDEEAARFCRQQTVLSSNAPDNPDLRYLAIRCMPDSSAKNQAFDDAQRRWPEHGWLAFASAYTAQERQDWQRANALLALAVQKIPAMTDGLYADLARMRRLQTANPQVDLGDLALQSPSLRLLQALDTGQNLGDGPVMAYHELAAGHLDAAVAKAKGSPYEIRVMRLAAASAGASRALIEQALALPLRYDQLDDVGLLAAIAVSLRAGHDIAPYHALLLRMGQDNKQQEAFEKLYRFAVALRNGKLEEADRALDGLAMQARGAAYSVGVSVLGARAPKNWQIGARCLLFGSERPYLA